MPRKAIFLFWRRKNTSRRIVIATPTGQNQSIDSAFAANRLQMESPRRGSTASRDFGRYLKQKIEFASLRQQVRQSPDRLAQATCAGKKSGAIAPLFRCQSVNFDVVSYTMQRHLVCMPFPTDLQSLAYSAQPFIWLGQHPIDPQSSRELGQFVDAFPPPMGMKVFISEHLPQLK